MIRNKMIHLTLYITVCTDLITIVNRSLTVWYIDLITKWTALWIKNTQTICDKQKSVLWKKELFHFVYSMDFYSIHYNNTTV